MTQVQSRSAHALRRHADRVVLAIGVLLIAAGTLISWSRHRDAADFYHPYVLGRMIVAGQDAYLPASVERFTTGLGHRPARLFIAYPPASGLAMLPFGALPITVAVDLWLLACSVVMLYGLGRLLKEYRPGMSAGTVGLLLGLVAVSSAARWGFNAVQSAPMICGLLALFVVALLRERPGAAFALALLALCLKVTNGLPFVGLLLLRRRFALAGAVLGCWVVLNAVAFARMGGRPAFAAFRHNVATWEAKPIDSPDPHEVLSMMRLDAEYLVNAAAPDAGRSKRFVAIFGVVAAMWLAWEALRCRGFWRDPSVTGMFIGPLVCLSLLVAYHHHYEASLLFVPLAFYVARWPLARRLPGVWWFVVPVAAFTGLWAVKQGPELARQLFGMDGPFYAKLMGVVIVLTAFGGSLSALHRFVTTGWREMADDTPLAGHEPAAAQVQAFSRSGERA